MRRSQGWLFLIAMALTAWGCGKSPEAGQTAEGAKDSPAANAGEYAAQKAVIKTDTPQETVQVFLDAVRMGNDERASAMISSIARQKTAALTGSITPPASDTAKFSIGKVEYIGGDGARVASIWSDVDEEGQAHSDEAVWVLRKESDGWRVAGVAAMIFPGEEPVLLNFEDPEDMKHKQQEVRNRMARETEAGAPQNLQAEQKDNPASGVRR
jgi:hypothetical protein